MMISSYYSITAQDQVERKQIKNSIVINPSKDGSDSYGQIVFPNSEHTVLFKTFLYGWKNEQSRSYDKILAYFRYRNNDYPLIGIDSGQVIVNFDFFGWEKRLLHEDYVKMERPFYTRLPFPYYKIPLSIRNTGFRMLSSLSGGGKKKIDRFEFPAFPTEPVLDQTRRLIWEAATRMVKVKLNKNPYPGNKRGCIVLTHDIETANGLKNIRLIREIERHFDYPSSWSIISKRYKTDDSLLKSLLGEGCEIISHGYLHDGLIPYLKEADILKRLDHLFIIKPWLKGVINGYRSGQLVTSASLFKCLAKRFKYDLSVPDTEKIGPYGPRGCCSIYPFHHEENILEIPLTVPQDYYHLYIYRYTEEEMLNLWKEKIDYIEENNGVAVLLLHPDTYLSGNKRMLELYHRLLEFVSSKDMWVATPGMVYNYIEGLSKR